MSDNYVTINAEKGTVNISEQVVSAIASAAVAEVEGAAGYSKTTAGELYEFLGKKPGSKGIRVNFEGDAIHLDITLMVKYGYGVAKVASEVQRSVISSLESMTGLTPVVNVSVTGIAFAK